MKRFTIILATILSAFMVGCINGGQKASINDLQLTSGFRDRKLMLEGTEGVSSTFSFIAKHDWSIIDYKGFSCNPSSGAKSEKFEEIRVVATPLRSNNSADTIRLSDLNFKLLSTRFVGISAYQLPQIRLPKGDKINLDAKRGAKGSLLFVSSSDDVELVTEGEISASLGEKNEKNEYTLTVTATEENLAAEDRKIGTIGFKVGGVMQASKIEVTLCGIGCQYGAQLRHGQLRRSHLRGNLRSGGILRGSGGIQGGARRGARTRVQHENVDCHVEDRQGPSGRRRKQQDLP